MKAIKFRVWNKPSKSFIYWGFIKNNRGVSFRGIPTGNYITIEDAQAGSELCTGLTDSTPWEELTKNEQNDWIKDGNTPADWKGREIYENDIIDIGLRGTFPVLWDDIMTGFTCGVWCGFEFSKGKIVGNMHENQSIANKKIDDRDLFVFSDIWERGL